jgi:hypothetical protein
VLDPRPYCAPDSVHPDERRTHPPNSVFLLLLGRCERVAMVDKALGPGPEGPRPQRGRAYRGVLEEAGEV